MEKRRDGTTRSAPAHSPRAAQSAALCDILGNASPLKVCSDWPAELSRRPHSAHHKPLVDAALLRRANLRHVRTPFRLRHQADRADVRPVGRAAIILFLRAVGRFAVTRFGLTNVATSRSAARRPIILSISVHCARWQRSQALILQASRARTRRFAASAQCLLLLVDEIAGLRAI